MVGKTLFPVRFPERFSACVYSHEAVSGAGVADRADCIGGDAGTCFPGLSGFQRRQRCFAGAVWAGVFFLSRYVSLASLAAALALPVSAWLLKFFAGFALPLPIGLLLILCAVLTFWRHRSNIVRLMNGTESRFQKEKKESGEN